MAVHEALSQRDVVRRLTRDELALYLAHPLRTRRNRTAALRAPPRSRYHATSGLPRKVNGRAHRALSAAALARPSGAMKDRDGRAVEERGETTLLSARHERRSLVPNRLRRGVHGRLPHTRATLADPRRHRAHQSGQHNCGAKQCDAERDDVRPGHDVIL